MYSSSTVCVEYKNEDTAIRTYDCSRYHITGLKYKDHLRNNVKTKRSFYFRPNYCTSSSVMPENVNFDVASYISYEDALDIYFRLYGK